MDTKTPVTPVTPATTPGTPVDPNELNFNKALLVVGMQAQYFRKLVVTGKIPAHKNTDGHWRFTKSELEAWKANRPSRSRSTQDGRTNYVVRVSAQEAEAVRKALPPAIADSFKKAWTTRPKGKSKAQKHLEQKETIQAVAAKAGVAELKPSK